MFMDFKEGGYPPIGPSVCTPKSSTPLDQTAAATRGNTAASLNERVLQKTLEYAIQRTTSIEQALRVLNQAVPIKDNAQLILHYLANIIDRQKHQNGAFEEKVMVKTKEVEGVDSNKIERRYESAVDRMAAAVENGPMHFPSPKRLKRPAPFDMDKMGEEEEGGHNLSSKVDGIEIKESPNNKLSASHLQELSLSLNYDFVIHMEPVPTPPSTVDNVSFTKMLMKMRLPVTADKSMVEERVATFLQVLNSSTPSPPRLLTADLERCIDNICKAKQAILHFLQKQDKYLEVILKKSESDGLAALLLQEPNASPTMILEEFKVASKYLTTGRMSICKDAKVAYEKLKMTKIAWDHLREEKDAKEQRDMNRLSDIRNAVAYILDRDKERHLFKGHPTTFDAKHPFFYFYLLGIDPKRVNASTVEKIGRRLKSYVHPDSLPKEGDAVHLKAREEAFKAVNTAVGECKKELDLRVYRNRSDWVQPPKPPYASELKLDEIGIEYRVACETAGDLPRPPSTHSAPPPSPHSAPPPSPPAESPPPSSTFEPNLHFFPEFHVECNDLKTGGLTINVFSTHHSRASRVRSVYVHTLRPTYSTAVPPSAVQPSPNKVCSTLIYSMDINMREDLIIAAEQSVQPWEFGLPKKYWVGVQFVYKSMKEEVLITNITWKEIELTLVNSGSKKCLSTLLSTFVNAEFVDQIALQNEISLCKNSAISDLRRLLRQYAKQAREWAECI